MFFAEYSVCFFNSNAKSLSGSVAELVETPEFSPPRWVATMAYQSGAGFYSATWGPLPFAFGPVKPEPTLVYVVRPVAP